jgi:hypothetical protein
VITRRGRAGIGPRREARRRQRAFVREYWPWLLGAGLLVILPLWIVGVDEGREYTIFLAGAFAASVGSTIVISVWVGSGSLTFMLGQQGEQWTSEELRPPGRRGWKLVDHVPLGGRSDADHVLIGPGGVYALETKVTGRTWNLARPDDRLVRAARQARRQARAVQMRLLANDACVRVEVHPVLVLWGYYTGSTEEVEGVPVVHGSKLREWAERLPDGTLTAEEVERAAAGLLRYVARREDHIQTTGG